MLSRPVSQKRWLIKAVHDGHQPLAQALGVLPETAQILIQRGVSSIPQAEAFIRGKLKDLRDPFLFNDMAKAVQRIMTAYERHEKILVHGDYDVDGITGTSLLAHFFSRSGLEVQPYIPHRVSEGYGVSLEAIAMAAREGYSLIITVDCGSSAVSEIQEAAAKGIDVIVVDHHELKDRLPPSVAMIHPKLALQNEDFVHLSAVGVAFKLAHGILKEAIKRGLDWARGIDLRDYLELVAIGTVADLVPLKGENRLFVRKGLEKLSKTKFVGLQALLKEIGLSKDIITTTDVGFRIAPRLNAAGRVGTAYDAIHLILSGTFDAAHELAVKLEAQNRERQLIEQQTFDEALEILKDEHFQNDRVIIVEKDDWPLGVMGIVASRILRERYRPVFVISSNSDVCKGSARSIRGFHLCDALKCCEDLLVGFGGHAYAAGIKIKKEKISEFRLRMNEYAARTLKEEDLIPSLDVDRVLSSSRLSMKLAEEIVQLGPYGQENPAPIFVSDDVTVDKPPRIVGEHHLKLFLRSREGLPISAIGFGMGSWLEKLSQGVKFKLAYELDINDFNDQRTIQLNIKDIQLKQNEFQKLKKGGSISTAISSLASGLKAESDS